MLRLQFIYIFLTIQLTEIPRSALVFYEKYIILLFVNIAFCTITTSAIVYSFSPVSYSFCTISPCSNNFLFLFALFLLFYALYFSVFASVFYTNTKVLKLPTCRMLMEPSGFESLHSFV